MVTAFKYGLRQQLHKSNAAVITIKPGLLDTSINIQFKKGILWAKANIVSAMIVKAIDKKKVIVYVLAFWWGVMAVIKLIPSIVFTKVSS